MCNCDLIVMMSLERDQSWKLIRRPKNHDPFVVVLMGFHCININLDAGCHLNQLCQIENLRVKNIQLNKNKPPPKLFTIKKEIAGLLSHDNLKSCTWCTSLRKWRSQWVSTYSVHCTTVTFVIITNNINNYFILNGWRPRIDLLPSVWYAALLFM